MIRSREQPIASAAEKPKMFGAWIPKVIVSWRPLATIASPDERSSACARARPLLITAPLAAAGRLAPPSKLFDSKLRVYAAWAVGI
jgi:hypothetical protein